MPNDTHKPGKSHVRTRVQKKGPDEAAPNATQQVEAQDKSSQTQNPGNQLDALKQNAEAQEAQRKASAEQPAGQHATGSFTGENPHRG